MHAPAPTRRRPPAGFTLVEMLTVIVIIGLLVSMITGAAISMRSAAQRALIRADITQLDMALEKYKQEYGEYPPDFYNLNSSDATKKTAARKRVLDHIKKVFPRVQISGSDTDAQWTTLKTTIKTATENTTAGKHVDIDKLTPQGALVFWLGGMPTFSDNGAVTFNGFSANPANPFQKSGSRKPMLWEFDLDRIREDSDGQLTYSPRENPESAAYVYRKAIQQVYLCETADEIKPYCDSERSEWIHPTKYQIISAGLDDGFGSTTAGSNASFNAAPLFPSGANFTDSSDGGKHHDNITNFAEGILEDQMQ